MTRRAAPLLLVLACATLAACGGSADAAQAPAPTSSTPSEFRVEGKIEVSGYASGTAEPNKCWSNDGYDDVADGAQVVVTGADGRPRQALAGLAPAVQRGPRL